MILPPAIYESSGCSASSQTCSVVSFQKFTHCSRCVVSLCGYNLHFCDDECWLPLHVNIDNSYIYYEVWKSFAHFKLDCLLLLIFRGYLIWSGYKQFVRYLYYKYFSQSDLPLQFPYDVLKLLKISSVTVDIQ